MFDEHKKAEMESVINEIAEKICKEIPEYCEINLIMENGAAWVTVYKNGWGLSIDNDKSLLEQLEEALSMASTL